MKGPWGMGLFVLLPLLGLRLCDLRGREGSAITINANPRYTPTTDILIPAVAILVRDAPDKVIYDSGTTGDLCRDETMTPLTERCRLQPKASLIHNPPLPPGSPPLHRFHSPHMYSYRLVRAPVGTECGCKATSSIELRITPKKAHLNLKSVARGLAFPLMLKPYAVNTETVGRSTKKKGSYR
ncbi:hypothetical protein EYF80_011448 [Liparis tanakae]|uniref:Uncharacterized protein n=1 Tax=Liparis tanakae TaxID=230148 RepID=A0A4Z2IK66_9TELE|nr:hypothetical protein EYF80_011448 [Liparis tanakae]